MNYDRAAMKEEVKQAMRRTRPKPMLVTLLFLVILGTGSSLISGLLSRLFSGSDLPLEDIVNGLMTYGLDYFIYYFPSEYLIQITLTTALVSTLASILTTIWSGLMDAGYAGYCLDMSRGMNPGLERIFGGFSRAVPVILAYILVAVFTFLWSLLFSVGLGVLLGIAFVIGAANDSMATVSVLLMVAATVGYIIAIIWVTFRYAMVPFAVMDSQTAPSALDAINTSKALMKGRKGSYFVPQISFFGWYLLELLIVLVGVVISGVSLFTTVSSFIRGLSFADYITILEGSYDFSALAVQLLGPVLIVALLCGVGIFIFELWLTPYQTGCNARFYTFATGGAQPIPPSPSGPSGGQPEPYNSQPEPSGGQPEPYGYTPLSQSPFGGSPQPEQPPRDDGSGYPQWGAPQAPEAPAAPAEPDDAPYEAPYSEPEEPGDDAPQQPGGPNTPQY